MRRKTSCKLGVLFLGFLLFVSLSGCFITPGMDTDTPYEYDNDVVKRYPPGQKEKQVEKKYQEKDVHPDRYLNKDNDKNIYNKEDNNRE